MPRPQGFKHSKTTKKKMSKSAFLLGRKGIKIGRTKEWIKKNCLICDKEFEVPPSRPNPTFCSRECQGKSFIGKPSWNKGLKGWRLGEKRPYISLILKGRKMNLSEETRKRMGDAHRGEKNYNWNPNREEVLRNKRNDGAYLQWVSKIKYRDNGVCRLQNENCMGYKVVHHILPWAQYPEERYNINNGITLCQYHHPRRREDETKLIPTLQELVALKNQ